MTAIAEVGTPPVDAPPRRVRRIGGGVLTAVAGVAVFAALVLPREIIQLIPLAFVRIPVEGIAAAALLLLLPPRARRRAAVVLGGLLGVLTVLRVLDMSFLQIFGRPFDPVLDWELLGNGTGLLEGSVGRGAAIAIEIGIAVLTVAVIVGLALAGRRLARAMGGRRGPVAKVTVVLGAAWLACAGLGLSLAPPIPLASRGVAALAWQNANQVPLTIADERIFEKQSTIDAYAGVPADRLLAGLRGHDVLLTFVESYGRSAVEDQPFAPGVQATLDAGTQALRAKGFAARSAWLTSPVSGGGSWMAHATLASGLWIDSNQRDRSLTTSDRLTLTRAFHDGGWHTTAVMPGTISAWPEARFWGIDTVYDRDNMGYAGLNFSWSPMPDQYTMAHFQRTEYAKPGRGPLMAQIVLTSSHVPWTPVPQMLDWNAVGDGSVYTAFVQAADPPDVVWQNPDRVRDNYRQTIQYSLNTLISWIQTYGDDNLVLVVLGDHQASQVITGSGASRDVPVSVIAKDPKVLDRIASWGWQDGLRPAPTSPVWKMDAFRDKFFAAYGDGHGG